MQNTIYRIKSYLPESGTKIPHYDLLLKQINGQYQKSKYSASNTKISPTVLWCVALSACVHMHAHTLASFLEAPHWTRRITALSGEHHGKAASNNFKPLLLTSSESTLESWDQPSPIQPHLAHSHSHCSSYRDSSSGILTDVPPSFLVLLFGD